MTDLWHPVLERTITVSPKMARLYRRSGWVDVQNDTVQVPSDGPLEADLEQGD